MGNSSSSSSNVTNDSRTECDPDGNCERVATSCVDGDCTETRTPIEDDETVEEGGDDETFEEGGDDETFEEGGDDEESANVNIYDEEKTETKVKKKSFPIGMIIFLILLVVSFFVVVLVFLFKKKSNIPKIPKIPKNPNLNKV